MNDECSEELDALEKEMPELFAWTDNVKLTEYEAESIKNSIVGSGTGYREGWSEWMSTRIDRAINRSQRRIEQKEAYWLQLQKVQITRRRIRSGS